ncbi:MAG: sigma 54 modulation/S30EA ribosomal C-terminal domain-containing protein, partial [Chloroflexota bacterium]
AVERMQRQIERYKTRHLRGRGSSTDLTEVALEAEADTEEAPSGPDIVRRKKFPITPMSEEEAIEQMALLQHDNFFIFFNADTARVNVLYTRKDGTLGLIEPEVA